MTRLPFKTREEFIMLSCKCLNNNIFIFTCFLAQYNNYFFCTSIRTDIKLYVWFIKYIEIIRKCNIINIIRGFRISFNTLLLLNKEVNCFSPVFSEPTY